MKDALLLPPPCYRALDGADEGLLVERLGENVHGSSGEGLVAGVVVAVSRDEDDRKGPSGTCDRALKLEPTHVRHANVDQEARGGRDGRVPKVRGRIGEGLDLVAGGVDEPFERPAHRGVVVHDVHLPVGHGSPFMPGEGVR
jgi:hypothetical protein